MMGRNASQKSSRRRRGDTIASNAYSRSRQLFASSTDRVSWRRSRGSEVWPAVQGCSRGPASEDGRILSSRTLTDCGRALEARLSLIETWVTESAFERD